MSLVGFQTRMRRGEQKRIFQAIPGLENAEFLFEDPTAAERQYNFKHSLTRDVAYQSLLAEVRRERHRKIAEVYEAQFAELCGTQPELVAHHFFAAGRFARAMSYYKMAGMRAAQRDDLRFGQRHPVRRIER